MMNYCEDFFVLSHFLSQGRPTFHSALDSITGASVAAVATSSDWEQLIR